PSLFVTQNTILLFVNRGSLFHVSLLVEITLSKQIGHEVSHVAGAKNRELCACARMHNRSVIPHRGNVTHEDIRAGSLEQIDLGFGGATAERMTCFTLPFERDPTLLRITWLKHRGLRTGLGQAAEVCKQIDYFLCREARPCCTGLR